MAKKKKRKVKVKRVILVIFIFAIFVVGLFLLFKVPIKGYYISGNTYYTDQQILEKTSLDKYPSYILTTSFAINQKIKKEELIEQINLKKKLNGMIEVEVIENKILFYDNVNKKSVLKNKQTSDYYYENSPVLINQIEDKKIYERFIVKLNKINDKVLNNISEIKYDPNELDKERFLFSMNDGNYVYLTLSKVSNINNYLEISNTLGEKNGILYLDYGNYFVPKE